MNDSTLNKFLEIVTAEFPEFALGRQRQQLSPAIHTGMSKGAEIHISSGVVRMAGGHYAVPHIHEKSAITVYLVSGKIASLVGEHLEPLFHAPGSVIYIGPGVPHLGLNLDPHQEATIFEARTDPAFNDDVVLREDLNDLADLRVEQLRREYDSGHLDGVLKSATRHLVVR